MSEFSDTTDKGKMRVPFVGSIVYEGIVIVNVSPSGQPCHVHKELLIQHSGFFRKALTGPWKETTEQEITLEDVEIRIFGLFVHWLYTQEFPQGDDGLGLSAAAAYDKQNEALEMCTKAYVLGDRFLAPEFRRAANNCLATVKHDIWLIPKAGLHAVVYAFNNIPADRVIVQALIDEMCIGWDEDNVSIYGPAAMSYLSPAILRRITHWTRERYERVLKRAPTSLCYFEHASDEEQGACQDMHMRWDGKKELAFFE